MNRPAYIPMPKDFRRVIVLLAVLLGAIVGFFALAMLSR